MNNNIPKWDHYLDRQLLTLTKEMNYDFELISKTFNNILKTNYFDKEKISKKYSELNKKRRCNIHEPTELEKALSKLPQERVNKNFLLVEEKDLEKEKSISYLTGEEITPNKFNIFNDKFYSEEYLENKKQQDIEFFKKINKYDKNLNNDEFMLYYIDNEEDKLKIQETSLFSNKGEEIIQRMKELESRTKMFENINHKEKIKYSKAELYKNDNYSDISVSDDN